MNRTELDNDLRDQAEEEENEAIYKDRLSRLSILLKEFRRKVRDEYAESTNSIPDIVFTGNELRKLDREYTDRIAEVFE